MILTFDDFVSRIKPKQLKVSQQMPANALGSNSKTTAMSITFSMLESEEMCYSLHSLWDQWPLLGFPALLVNTDKSFCGIHCYRDSPGTVGLRSSGFAWFFSCLGELDDVMFHLNGPIASWLMNKYGVNIPNGVAAEIWKLIKNGAMELQ